MRGTAVVCTTAPSQFGAVRGVLVIRCEVRERQGFLGLAGISAGRREARRLYFETDAFNHSATSPYRELYRLPGWSGSPGTGSRKLERLPQTPQRLLAPGLLHH